MRLIGSVPHEPAGRLPVPGFVLVGCRNRGTLKLHHVRNCRDCGRLRHVCGSEGEDHRTLGGMFGLIIACDETSGRDVTRPGDAEGIDVTNESEEAEARHG